MNLNQSIPAVTPFLPKDQRVPHGYPLPRPNGTGRLADNYCTMSEREIEGRAEMLGLGDV